ncbi:MAG: hypothetical protein AAFU67_03595 [Bacteroidota bacterium]
MILSITRNGESLDLLPGTSLGVDVNTPIYFGDRDPELIPGLKSYSLTVPPTNKNRRLLNRPAELDNPKSFLTESGWIIYHDGRLISSGQLLVEDAGYEQDIRVTFIGGISGNLSGLKSREVGEFVEDQSFNVGVETQDVYAYAKEVILDPENYDFMFPTINVAEDSGLQPGDNEDDPGVPTRYAFFNLYESGRFALSSSVRYGLSPVVQPVIEYSTIAAQPRLHWVMKKMFAAIGYNLTGVFDSDVNSTELKDLLLVTNHTQDRRTRFLTEEPTMEDIELDPTFRPARMMPKVKGNVLLKKICNRFCWTPFVDEQNRRVRLLANRDLLKDETFVDWTGKVDPRYLASRSSQEVPQNFSTPFPKDDAFSEEFVIKVPAGATIQEYQTFSDLNNAPIDFNQVYYVASINEFCTLRGFAGSRRIYQSLGRDLGQTARGQEPVYTAGATTLLTRTAAQRRSSRWIVLDRNYWFPAWFMTPDSPLLDGELTSEVILLFYRGLQANRYEQRLYPYASAGRYNVDQEIVGNLSLLWNGDGGLFEVWWRDWIELLHRMKPVTYPVRLTSQDLADLDFSKKVLIGQHLYFVRRVRTNLEENGVSQATVDLYKIT